MVGLLHSSSSISIGPVCVDGILLLCTIYSYFLEETSRKEHTEKRKRKMEALKKIKSLNCSCRMQEFVYRLFNRFVLSS
jgi:hypothetical protein